MIIQCDKCGATYRVAKEKLVDRTLRMKCPGCKNKLVFVGPPPNKQLTRHIKLHAKRVRRERREAIFRKSGRGLAGIFILALVSLGTYFTATTPGIPTVYAIAFLGANCLVWGISAARLPQIPPEGKNR